MVKPNLTDGAPDDDAPVDGEIVDEGPAKDGAIVGLEQELVLFLRRAQSFSGRLARELHPELEAPAYALLAWVDSVGSARLTDIAASFGVGKATLSRQVNLLERLELVARVPDPSDGRAQSISLTPVAARKLGQIRAARRERLHDLLGDWPEGDVTTLAGLLGRLNSVVGEGRTG